MPLTVVALSNLGLEDNPVYEILNPIDELTIGSTSGVLSTTKYSFDREQQATYQVRKNIFILN